MAVQIRSKRKKNFKGNEGFEIHDPTQTSPSTPVNDRDTKLDMESGLNVRRSSRKPKPKKHSDEFEEGTMKDVKIKEEPLEEDEMPPTVFMSDTPVFDAGTGVEASPFVSPGARRETRKSYQSYLEKLGYNTDFSKIAEPKNLLSQKGHNSKRVKGMTDLKSEGKIKDSQPEKAIVSSNVRSSSRTPKPRKSFDSLDKRKSPAPYEGIENIKWDTTSNSDRKGKSKLPASDSAKDGLLKHPNSKKQSISTPVSSKDSSEALSDGSVTRTSGRIRVPKRQFSLLEEKSQPEAKRQRMTPTVPQITKTKESENIDQLAETKASPPSNVRKCKKTNEKMEHTSLKSCPKNGKNPTENLNIKRDVDTSQSAPKTERDRSSKKGRERIEKIVESLLLAKQSDSGSTQGEAIGKDGLKRLMKRKRGISCDDGSKKMEIKTGGKKLEADKQEHIVVKLHIPHGKSKDEHHHKHHHKQKKTKELSEKAVEKKTKSKLSSVKPLKKHVSSKSNGKRTLKVNIKQEPKDDEAHPHVKLIIKKSPTKSTEIAEVLMQDMSEQSTDLNDDENQDVTDRNERDVKEAKTSTKTTIPRIKTEKKIKSGTHKTGARMKKTGDRKKVEVKKRNLIVKKTYERIKKTVFKKSQDVKATPLKKKKEKPTKVTTVSAYSLFTKNRRKGLLEKEPNLDFASTSRRLAEMWRNLPCTDQEYWKAKARAVRLPNGRDSRSYVRGRKARYDSYNWSQLSDVPQSFTTGIEAIDMAAHLKLLGESLCSIGMCLKRQDQMEVHGSLSVLLDTALCSIVPIFFLTSQLPEMAACPNETQAQILDNLAYIIPGL